MVGMSAVLIAAALSQAVPQVEIKVYRGERPVLMASVDVNVTFSLRGADRLTVDGEVDQVTHTGDVTYRLRFSDGFGHDEQVFVSVPFETCTQRVVELDQAYVVRLCGAEERVRTPI